jgi:hypothetical protein
VSLIEDHDAKRLLGKRTALTFVIAHDDKARRHDPNSPGAFRHECGIAFLGQRATLAVKPALLLGRPNRRWNTELVFKFLLPLPNQGCWSKNEMIHSFPELTIGGVLVAPFLIYAGAAIAIFALLRPSSASSGSIGPSATRRRGAEPRRPDPRAADRAVLGGGILQSPSIARDRTTSHVAEPCSGAAEPLRAPRRFPGAERGGCLTQVAPRSVRHHDRLRMPALSATVASRVRALLLTQLRPVQPAAPACLQLHLQTRAP